MMKHFFALTTLLLGLVISPPSLAKCDQEATEQRLRVVAVNNGYAVEPKQDKRCLLKNNGLSGTASSVVIVDFSAVNCQVPRGCRVILKRRGEPEDGPNDDAPQPPNRALLCKADSASSSCYIYGNHLANFCDDSLNAGNVGADSCKVRYVIRVGKQKVDPIIVIRPRPSELE